MVVIVIVITTTVASQWLIITPSLPRAVPACLHAPQTLKPNPSTLQTHEHRSTGAGSLSAQEGLPALLKRLFILHSSKLMALAVFWAAMQQPGAIGWLLTCESRGHSFFCLANASMALALSEHTPWVQFGVSCWCMLAHRTGVQAYLVGTWQEQLAGTPVNCYYMQYVSQFNLQLPYLAARF